MENWSITFEVLSKDKCIIGFMYREGDYKSSAEDKEIKVFSEILMGIAIASVTIKLFWK